ncbi:MAG: SDR family NAD(P)-dependent oxidoreductase [Cardiobacterium sp.]
MKQTTVIISGHSHGLGAALTAAWLQHGARVLGLARRHNPELAASHPGQLQETAIDLADPQAVLDYSRSDAFRHTCQTAETLWLINNAGTVAPSAPLGAQPDDVIIHAVGLNITAPLLLANAVLAHARDHDRVRIVHISSGAARKPYPGWSIYGASKAALDRHAADAAAEGVRITSLAPGVVDTAMQAGMRADPAFPLRDQFAALHADGKLQSAAATAAQILAYCQSDQFAREPIADIRTL